jgi:hypothetical protein
MLVLFVIDDDDDEEVKAPGDSKRHSGVSRVQPLGILTFEGPGCRGGGGAAVLRPTGRCWCLRYGEAALEGRGCWSRGAKCMALMVGTLHPT